MNSLTTAIFIQRSNESQFSFFVGDRYDSKEKQIWLYFYFMKTFVRKILDKRKLFIL